MRAAPSAHRPLTDPADFWTLIGRFMAGQVLNVLLLGAVLQHIWSAAIFLAIASLVVHRAMVGLYRRLRRERAEALAARGAPEGEPAP